MYNNLKRIGKFLLVSGYQAKVLYFVAHYFERNGMSLIAQLITRISIIINGIEISPKASLSRSIVISHGLGTVIGEGVKIGENVIIRQNVTIGQKGSDFTGKAGYPILLDNITIGAGTVILGDITVGENVTIGANTVITKDVPPNCTIAGVPYKIIK